MSTRFPQSWRGRFEPGQLWSLWDMHELLLGPFAKALDGLGRIALYLEGEKKEGIDRSSFSAVVLPVVQEAKNAAELGPVDKGIPMERVT